MGTLQYQKKNLYETMSKEERAKVNAYAEGYKHFLDNAKTEREAVSYLVERVEEKGYTPYTFGEALRAGDKKYVNNRNKSLILFRIGTEDAGKNGVRVMAAHIDSPRLDLKQNPLYERDEIAFFKTHYYGGIKKYQWTTIPLALHGVVHLADGTKLEVKIGEEEADPVFYVSDLLPHLAANQMKKPLAEAIEGESLNIWVGITPSETAEKDKFSYAVLEILNEKYGIVEEDFLCAELCAVPAYKARDIGFDRALLGGYGHDDRVCAYPQYTALMENEDCVHTVFVVFADKEEIGSEGTTGMQTELFPDLLKEVAKSLNVNEAEMRAHSKCISADVTVAYDPNFADVCEKNNSTKLSCGAGISKFTGSRGKSGSSDAHAEYMQEIRSIFAESGVTWQIGELGKVDQGGGGTVAKFIAKLNIDTVDLGVPVISMHSPFEAISKADLYATALAFKAFIKG
ncbi:MAG: aminopeptidase [Clostridia bacterium]|nr:aminopeptidase [Clostridia bacterium]